VLDFDLIYTSLVAPAIDAAGLESLRWDDISASGAIGPVLERLVVCDFVVADISVSSPNVFYELGIRHASRPNTTVLIARQGSPIPLDLSALRVILYRLNETGRPEDVGSFNRAMVDILRSTLDNVPDSPLFQFLDVIPPQLKQRRNLPPTATSRSGSDWKRRISQAKLGGVEELANLENELADVSPEVLLELFRAYRSASGWLQMIALARKMPAALATSAMVQEQLALALNRAGDPARAEVVLNDLLRRNGPSSETYGILGRVYKDRWQIAAESGDPEAAKILDQAIDCYVKGFEEDWRDYYPGINAITLMDLRGTPDPRTEEMIPVVRYAVKRKLAKGKSDYWDLATLLELEVLDGNRQAASSILGNLRSAGRETWQIDTTVRNLSLIRKARESRGGDAGWIAELEQQLSSASQGNLPALELPG
jgi:uncharacterized protein DUF4071